MNENIINISSLVNPKNRQPDVSNNCNNQNTTSPINPHNIPKITSPINPHNIPKITLNAPSDENIMNINKKNMSTSTLDSDNSYTSSNLHVNSIDNICNIDNVSEISSHSSLNSINTEFTPKDNKLSMYDSKLTMTLNSYKDLLSDQNNKINIPQINTSNNVHHSKIKYHPKSPSHMSPIHTPTSITPPLITSPAIKSPLHQNNINECENPLKNRGIMIQLKKIGEKSVGYRWMHDKEAMRYERIQGCLKKIDIVFISINSILSGSTIIFSISDILKDRLFIVILSCLTMVINFILLLIKGFLGNDEYQKKIRDHTYSSNKYNEIFLTIQNHFMLDINDREIDKDFLINKTKEYNDLRFISPTIKEQTLNKYINASGKHDIYTPLLIGDLEKIEIIFENNKDESKVTIKADETTDNYNNKLIYELDRFINNV
jgi:hypothetical protein